MFRYICLITAAVLMLSSCAPAEESKTDKDGYKIESPAKPVYNPMGNDELMMYVIRPDTMNPILTQFKADRDLFSLVYEPLIAVKNNFTADFRLAEKAEISGGGKTLTVTLKNGIKWHDGSELSAKDVSYTIKAIKDAGEACRYYQNVENIESTGGSGNTVKFTLKNPDSGFMYLLTFPIIKSSSGDFKPVGTGMYKFTDYDSPSEYTLEKNEHYTLGEVNIDKVKVNVLPDTASAANGFKMNSVDAAFVRNDDLAKYTVSKNIKSKSVNTSKYTYLTFDSKNTLLNETELKKAIKRTIATAKITTDLLPKKAVLCDSPVHPNASYALKNENKETESVKEALEKNGYILDEDGYRYKKTDSGKKRLSFSLLINADNSARVIMGDFIKSALEGIGMSIKLVKASNETYASYAQNGKYDMVLCETEILENYDLTFMLGTGGALNLGGYSSEVMDDLLNKARTAENEEERIKYMKKIQKQFEADLPHIPLYFSLDKLMYNSLRFENIESGCIGGGYLNANKWILKKTGD